MDNVFNRTRSRNEKKLKIWRKVGLMLTYKCNAKCRFCYYNCGPEKGGLMSLETAMNTWQGLADLAGRDGRVHITGGEPFLYFDRLCEICRQVQKERLPGMDMVETNAGWAVNDEIVTKRLTELKKLGVTRIKASYDPFHAEFIEAENLHRLIRAGQEILGPGGIMVRWEKYLQQKLNIADMSDIEKERYFKKAIEDDPCMFTGRAAEILSELTPAKPVEQFRGQNCKVSFLGAAGVHVDPGGNVFSGQCSGIITGNTARANLRRIWENFEPETSPIVKILYSEGPFGLLYEAVKKGYHTKSCYVSKCHLCSDLRQFFFDSGEYGRIIGPADCY